MSDGATDESTVGASPAPAPASASAGQSRLAASVAALDRALYALFGRHADGPRHERDRLRYRGTNLGVGFDVYLARVYGASWLVAAGLFLGTAALGGAVPDATLSAAVEAATAALPRRMRPAVPVLPSGVLTAATGVVAAAAGKRGVRAVGSQYLRWRTAARRANVDRTLPGAVRYLHVLASGSDGTRAMLRKVAETDAYGETAVSLNAALTTAALTGSVEAGLGRVARDTPSQDALAPFLLKFREHASQGGDALSNYLRMESRMLGHRQARDRKRAEGFLELLAELFIVLLVLPALLVIVLTVMSVIAPGLSDPVATPLGTTTVRGVVVYASAAFILVVGLGASHLISSLRPPDQRVDYDRPSRPLSVVLSSLANPACAAVTFLAPAGIATLLVAEAGARPVNVALFGYVAYAVPVGVVAVRRAARDDAKDREMRDFVHAVSGHVSLGRPFPQAVETVARDVDLGALNDDVADLALNMTLTTPRPDADGSDLRGVALDRFVERVGTPLAEQTIGLVRGALDAGSDTETVFETLQSEIGRLYHEKRALRSGLLVYVAVGWTTALLVVGITVAVGIHVFDGFAQLSAVSPSTGFALDPRAVDLERDRFRIYVVTQATVLASGWFAGTASRGRYEALLHSGVLVVACYVVYAAAGMI